MSKERVLITFIFEQHNRLSCIVRFNNTPRLASENVAEHSYYVAFLSMLIGDYLEEKGLEFDKLRLLRMALVHDVEEIISGDIIKVLKSGEFKKELDNLNLKSMQSLTGVLGEKGKLYLDLWQETKDKKTLEAKIVDLVDTVALMVYCMKEVHLGNRFLRGTLAWGVEEILKFSERIPEAGKIIDELGGYALAYLQEDK